VVPVLLVSEINSTVAPINGILEALSTMVPLTFWVSCAKVNWQEAIKNRRVSNFFIFDWFSFFFKSVE
jgi:hypothetical protein